LWDILMPKNSESNNMPINFVLFLPLKVLVLTSLKMA
jgi:hypothetical protein